MGDPGYTYQMADCNCNGHCSNDAAKTNPEQDPNLDPIEESIQKFEDYNRDKTIQVAMDKAFPIFGLFGWTWYDGPPTRDRMEQSLNELTDSALESLREDGSEGGVSSGRFTVRAYWSDDTGLVVSYDIELAESDYED
jgi:hypothetical protein